MTRFRTGLQMSAAISQSRRKYPLDILGMDHYKDLTVRQCSEKNSSTSKTRMISDIATYPYVALQYCKSISITCTGTKPDALIQGIHWSLVCFRNIRKIPELNDEPVFVVAQNSADMPEIDAKTSNGNDGVDRNMGNNTIEPTTPLRTSPGPSSVAR